MMKDNRAVAGLTVAVLALSLAWGTTATAGSSEQSEQQAKPALSKAEKKAVKKLARTISRRQAAKEIRRAAPTLSVGSARTADTATTATSATNAQHAERATLADTATMATNAQNAANAGKVGGLDVKKFVARVDPDAAAATLVSELGFTITASCPGGLPELRAASTVPGGVLRTTAIDNNEQLRTNGASDLDPAGLTFHANLGNGLGSATAEFTTAAGQVVSTWIGYRNDAPSCVFFGNHLAG